MRDFVEEEQEKRLLRDNCVKRQFELTKSQIQARGLRRSAVVLRRVSDVFMRRLLRCTKLQHKSESSHI